MAGQGSKGHGAGPSAADLAALAGKYRTLAALRRAKAAGEPEPERATFRALAQTFPGALRELDTVTLGELDRRAEALERAASGDAAALEPWMPWLHGYHLWMRAALALKRRLVRQRRVAEPDAARLAAEVGARLGLALDAAFVHDVADPPTGRLRPLVLARLSHLHGVPAGEITAALFPRPGAPDAAAGAPGPREG